MVSQSFKELFKDTYSFLDVAVAAERSELAAAADGRAHVHLGPFQVACPSWVLPDWQGRLDLIHLDACLVAYAGQDLVLLLPWDALAVFLEDAYRRCAGNLLSSSCLITWCRERVAV